MVVFAFAWSAWTQDVIYVTPSQPIYYGSAPTTQNIDITGSGCTNFILVCDGAGGSFLYPKASNTMVVVPLPPPDISSVVAALNPGDVVGPNASSINPAYQWWDATNDSTGSSTLADQIESDSQLYVVDNFAGQTAYIGFDIVRNGENYYGWMEVENPFEIAAGSIVGWAYATTPNTPIVAGAGLWFHWPRLKLCGGKSPSEVAIPDRAGLFSPVQDPSGCAIMDQWRPGDHRHRNQHVC